MNDDLISRKELLDRLRGNVLVDVTPALEEAIENQPAAFDKEKVIKELSVKAQLSKNRANFFVGKEFENGKERAYRRAIEVVQKGGVT